MTLTPSVTSAERLLKLARAARLQRSPVTAPIEPVDRGGPLPLSFAQQRLWFLEQLGGLGDTYHIPTQLRLGGDLDLAALRRALDAMLARHEALRTTFVEVGGEPVQRIAPPGGFPLVEHDLREHPHAPSELRRLAAEEAGALFDLEHGPLIRGRLVRLPGDDHLLLMTMHHIVSDGWSMGVLTRELGILYAAFRRGEENPLPPLPIQYADYAAWQRKWVAGEVLRQQAEYWKTTLAGVPELLELPTDHPRPTRKDHAGIALEIDLGEELTAGLNALSQRRGTTPFVTLLAGWAVVLGRLSGQDDVVVGAPSANRGRTEIEGLIGFFVNILPLRVDLSGSPTVAELLEQVRTRSLGAQQNQDIPFEQVVELVSPARSLAHTPLFQVMFAWQGASEARPGLPGPRGGGVGRAAQATTAKFDLSLALGESGGRIMGSVVYATSLFEQATIERHLAYLRRVLEAMAADDLQRVDALPLLPEAERRRVVEEWNRTDADFPRDTCVHELFEAQVERAPDARAVAFGAEALSYGELNRRANRLAHHLRALGVGPDARVAICVGRGMEMMVGLLAIVKAGGAYVPLDPAYPAERLGAMLADSAPVVVLTEGSLAGLFGGTEVRVIDLVADARAWAGQPETNPGRPGTAPDHLAYVIYTSGSTGQPKGVMVEHRSLANLVAWHCAAFGVKAGDRSSSVAGFGFDATTWEVWPPLCAGAALMLPATRDPQALLEWWEEQALDVSFLPTPLAEVAFARGRASAGLRTLLIGGDRLRSLPAEPLPFTLVNNYGPTETTVVATSGEIGASAKVHIGRPIANTRVYLLDRAGEPVPEGVAGELYIGGAGVARGYQHRPGLTAERFVPDPFAGAAGARLYRTGDLARWLADGTLEFLGRTDFQVKIRGFRIEPGEIEARLSEHPAVRDAVVLVRQDASEDRRLVAYYVGEALDVETLRTHLSERLPEYMVPAAFVPLQEWPLTPNGKLDRKALPAPEGDAYARRGYEAPVGETERALAEIWSELLGMEQAGRWDHFFELGGHSLLAVRLTSRVRQVLGAEVALADLFDRPVLADLARTIEDAARTALPPIERVDRGERLPLSFAQQRLWFLEQMGDLGSTYHVPTRLRLRGELDRGALRRALDAMLARHEALRTTFVQVDSEPVQRIAEESPFHLLEHDLGGDADAEAQFRRLAAEEAGARFDLEQGPLIRGRLVRLAEDDHVLLLTMHHIVSDGWSMGVLTRELGALYAAFRRGEENPLPPLPIQYADYAAWQRQWVGGEVLREQAEYWKQALSGAPELLELPTDRPRPARPDHVGGTVGIDLGDELSAGLRALSRRHGTTLFMTLLAGWAAVLGRLSGQEDVVVGTPSANRGRREIEGLIGLFVNTLALRIELGGSPSVSGLLEQARARALGAQQNQDIPFEQVVELVQPTRSLAHNPLFQVMLTWQSASEGGPELPGPRLGSAGSGPPREAARGPSQEAAQGTAKVDLSLTLWESGGRIVGGATYATALFDQASVERHLAYLRRVLEAFAADDLQAVDALPLLPAAERRLVVEEWNATDAAYPRESCIHELVEAQVERAPDAVAVVFDGGELTYAELNERANRLAHHLRGLGVGPDARVAICVERGPAMAAGLLAILKAGGGYVPLDPGYPAERLRYMLHDSAPAAVLTQGSLKGVQALFAGVDVPVIDLEGTGWARFPATDPERAGLTPGHLAYVIYTSGSTGTPKGVMIEHRSLANHTAWQAGAFGMGPDDAVLQRTSISFDASVWELWTTLAVGARLVLLPVDAAKDPGAIARVIEERGVTVVQFVPTLLQAVLRGLPEGAPLRPRLVFCGGEPLAAALVAEARARGVGEVVNLYGPTEATIDSTAYRCGDEDRAPAIGAPVGNVRVYVLDAAGEPVPVGVAGELFIGGAGVARGYLDRPAVTAERFVPDPFGGQPGARLYRTGDLGRWRADGTLEFLGRNDFQVKIRGFRVELGEIEARLLEHPSVREAVVAAREDAAGDRRLVAYVVGSDSVEVEALRSYLSERLPEHMVPAAYVHLLALPLTPNGKLDRKALPAPEGDAYARRGYEAPVGETEQALAEVWSELLGLEQVGRWDSFFELGGHSLLAVRVISRVRQVLGAEVGIGDLFERPVLADFARGVQEAARTNLPPIEPVERSGALPLSFAQQRLWFMEQLDDLGSTYHIPTRLRLPGELDRAALRRALDAIVARHEALRTAFVEVDGEPVQRIAEASPFHLLEHDLGGHPDAAAELHRLAAGEAGARFDLEQGPPIRGRLVRLAEDDHVLLMTMHHIVSDAWSMEVLTRELRTLYDAFRRGEANPLVPLPVQYADYAAWQRKWVAGEVLREQAEYWTRTLAGAPELLELPTDHPRPSRQDHAGGMVGISLDEDLSAALKELSRRHGTTLFMTVLAGWAAVLGRVSGQGDVVVGTPTANRGRTEIEGLIGFFVNTLALRVDLSGPSTVAELLEQVRARSLGAQQHQDIPFEQVVELVSPARSMAHTPLFQVMFSWLNASEGRPELPGPRVGSVASAALAAAKFDLSLALGEAGERIAGSLVYATSLFEQATIERHLAYLRRVLEAMAADDLQRVDALPLLPEAERRLVLEEWNATGRAYPTGGLRVHDLFRAQAARTPHAVALSWRGERWTYAELERRANQIANALRRRGVGPEVRVGICLPRTPDLVAAMLGVLGAGGAYVPLDPAYPRERLGYMLEDAGVALVVTESGLADRLPGDAATLLLDREHDVIAAESADAFESGVLPENLSHVIFTSGSTGRPKGVMIRHSSVVVLLHWLRENVTDEERSSVLFSTSINFDVSIAEVFGTLAWGGKLVLVENALELATVDEDVVHVSMVPSAAAELLKSGGIPASVKTLNLGGEPLPNALAQGLYALGTVQKVGNLYGPTEDTTYSTYYVVPRGAEQVLVGTQVANTQAYVLDAHLQPVPMGAVGELYLAGDGLSRGYANRPAMTAERFVPCPFGPPGSRMYRVMDRVRWKESAEVRECVSAVVGDSRGAANEQRDPPPFTHALTHSRTHALEYLGRIDFQVKVRGYRIELGEIEARLAEHPGVRAPVVLVREDAPGDRRLVAYHLGDEPVAVDALRVHLAERLPEYMVPAAYVWMEAYPLTPNGKVDRRALPAPEGNAYSAGEYAAPVGETEEALAGIWAEVLGVERVGRHDNFFELGGHSLLAVRVISRMRQVLGVEAPLAHLFSHPTVESLAARVSGSELQVESDRAIAIRPSGSRPPLFLVHEGAGSTAYAQVLHPHLDGDIPVYALPAPSPSEPPLRTVEGMATRLVRMIREVQPS
ncbi:amino acid adenylation domain-containing protein, partial [Longimicrobium sp.]|uniref:amino acid adenylation domain-containing protein n=1 Tax=Longimicrobium sp. TaxID=2029185 RepID=UPI002ED92B97